MTNPMESLIKTWPQWLVAKVKLSRYTPTSVELTALGKGIYGGEEALLKRDVETLDVLSKKTATHPLTRI
jgi:hypothetical protein